MGLCLGSRLSRSLGQLLNMRVDWVRFDIAINDIRSVTRDLNDKTSILLEYMPVSIHLELHIQRVLKLDPDKMGFCY